MQQVVLDIEIILGLIKNKIFIILKLKTAILNSGFFLRNINNFYY